MIIREKGAPYYSTIVTNARLDYYQPVAGSRWPTVWMNYSFGIVSYGAVVYSEYGASEPNQLQQGDVIETSIQIFDKRQPGQLLSVGYKKLVVPANPKQTQRMEFSMPEDPILFPYFDEGRGYEGTMMTPYIKFSSQTNKVGIWGTMNTCILLSYNPSQPQGAFI